MIFREKRAKGPSPRARGSPPPRTSARRAPGSIPASAGEPRSGRSRESKRWVHPRERGGAAAPTRALPRMWVHPRERGGAAMPPGAGAAGAGPSPRARGSRERSLAQGPRFGSIPASAGEPQRLRHPGVGRGVHPRERGGARASECAICAALGPSPRARGSQLGHRRGIELDGSIPASAGEPGRSMCRRTLHWVHPRERGGARSGARPAIACAGPSPRARGSLPLLRSKELRHGSIPASAGEPHQGEVYDGARGVHPRERGGAGSCRWRRLGRRGSIPASAGEPRRAGPIRNQHVGPSPRARGSHWIPLEHGAHSGSIPASAGEPHRRRGWAPCRRVHPRERGGAIYIAEYAGERAGPSPRARGSPEHRLAAPRLRGSIPASAGEPRAGFMKPPWRGVHPRERGGASRARERVCLARGPSPRARGSPGDSLCHVAQHGSIPASAGEPARCPRDSS